MGETCADDDTTSVGTSTMEYVLVTIVAALTALFMGHCCLLHYMVRRNKKEQNRENQKLIVWIYSVFKSRGMTKLVITSFQR